MSPWRGVAVGSAAVDLMGLLRACQAAGAHGLEEEADPGIARCPAVVPGLLLLPFCCRHAATGRGKGCCSAMLQGSGPADG